MPGVGQLVQLDDTSAAALKGTATNPSFVQAQPTSYTLLSNQTANGNGTAVTGVRGGDYVWRVEGTFGSGTVTLQVLGLDGSTWATAKKSDGTTDVTATAAASIGVGIGQNATVRAVVSGATAPALYSSLAGL